MKLDKIIHFGRSLLRMGLLEACFLLLICFLTGCGPEDKLLSELRQEDMAGDEAENAGNASKGPVAAGDEGNRDASGVSAEAGAKESRDAGGVSVDGGSSEEPNADRGSEGSGAGGNKNAGPGTAGQEKDGILAVSIYVHVCGAVVNPGVYELPAESRFYEAVDAAGGYTEDACENYLNMAAPLVDGSRLEIPTEQEVLERKTAESGSGKAGGIGGDTEYNYYTVPEIQADKTGNIENTGITDTSAEGLVNINTASVAGLCMLPGVGESRAKAIIEYREKQGGFQKKEDIMEVSGIGEKMYEKMEAYLTVE